MVFTREKFKCHLCDANYIGYMCRHLHQRVEEHKHSVIGKHFLEKHNSKRMNLNTNFKVLKKCRGKLECLIFEMIIIRNKRRILNTQADSILPKRFILLSVCSIFTPQFNFDIFLTLSFSVYTSPIHANFLRI